MGSVIGFLRRNHQLLRPTLVAKTEGALRLGVLGAANITSAALINPATSHPDVVVFAVAARDKTRAQAQATKCGIPKVHGSYQELLDDPEIDAIYNPLPNGLHYEWTMKALMAGKHVLLEKPSANTAEETRRMFALAAEKQLVLLEAFHYRFHPAIRRVKAILDSGEIGAVRSIAATLVMTPGLIKKGDIRFDYGLGGGAAMDMGCYVMSVTRYLGGEPAEVLAASHTVDPAYDPSGRTDRGTEAHLALASGAIARITCDMAAPYRFGIIPPLPEINVVVVGEKGEVMLTNFVMPTLWHSIQVRTDVGEGGHVRSRTEKVYEAGRGEAWWSTYRFQLEAFVDRLRGRQPEHWVSAEDSIQNMHWIEQVYEKGGLGARPASTFVPQP